MPGNIAYALVYIIQAISYLVLGVLLLRLLLPFLRADFRNPEPASPRDRSKARARVCLVNR